MTALFSKALGLLVLFSQLIWIAGISAQTKEAVEHELREGVTYKVVGGQSLLVDIYIPKLDTKCPAVLVVHGGAWKEGDRKQLAAYAKELSSRGFCCFAISYRLAPKHKFPTQIDDCRAAVKWVRENANKYNVDGNRIGAIGYSAGGHLASLLATTGESPTEENGNVDSRLQAVVAGGAPTDFRWMPDNGEWARYWMGGNLSEVPEKFELASTAAFIDADDPPFFFFHGKNDSIVPLFWASGCHLALKHSGVRSTMRTINGAGHIKAAFDKDALSEAFDFLETELKTKLAEPQGLTK